MMFRVLLLIAAQMAMSTAVIMLKASTEHPFLVASYRLLLASIILSPFFIKALKRSSGQFGARQVGWTVLPAIALAFHFISWVYAARMTPVANASLLVNLTPVVLPILLWLFYHERVTMQEILGTMLALGGVLILTAMNLIVNRNHLWGESITLASMVGLACYLALGRKNSHRTNIWLYLVPMYFIAGLLCFFTALIFVNPIKTYIFHDVLLIFGLALLPTVIGHSILNYSLKYFRGQVVGIANLSQPVFAGLMGFVFFSEKPEPVFYLAAVLIAFGIVVAIRQDRKNDQKDV